MSLIFLHPDKICSVYAHVYVYTNAAFDNLRPYLTYRLKSDILERPHIQQAFVHSTMLR